MTMLNKETNTGNVNSTSNLVSDFHKEYESKNGKFLLFDYYGFDEQHQLVEYTISYHHPSYTSFKFEADIHLD